MFTKIFEQLNSNNVDIAGGKGASLGEMTQAGIVVPPGFVVLASAFEDFIHPEDSTDRLVADLHIAIQAELDGVNYEDTHSIDRTSVVVRDLIRDTQMPDEIKQEIQKQFEQLDAEYVAVRSSATAEDGDAASWAGELESYLNTTQENLFENVKLCWSSLFTPRAIFYRHEKKLLDTHVSVAVVIQKMIQSEISGITFTVHPVTQDVNQMIIEAGWGLGEAIVSGSITPDSYIIDKRDYTAIDINVSEQEKQIVRQGNGIETVDVPSEWRGKQKLTGEQVMELAKLCGHIEDHYGKPMDIEWAYERGKFYIVQARPITTL